MKFRFLFFLLLPFFANASNETCADFLGAVNSGELENIFNSYTRSIESMDYPDNVLYKKRFLDNRDNTLDMFQRALNKCNSSELSTSLSDVVKATI